MRIELLNKYGRLEIGGGAHPSARLLQIKGIGIPAKEPEAIVFAGQPGQVYQSIRDMPRTITMQFEFFGGPQQLEQINRMIYEELEIRISCGAYRRKIKGICINPEEIEGIIYHSWYRLVLQLVCNNPYFNDFNDTRVVISRRKDLFPNLLEDDVWKIALPAAATERIQKTDIVNYGLINIYPVITVYNNPASEAAVLSEGGLEIYNETTGKRIALNYELSTGEELTVDLPARRIISNLSGVITNCISDDTVLSDFYLVPGENTVSVTNYNTASEIAAVLRYNNYYASAVI